MRESVALLKHVSQMSKYSRECFLFLVMYGVIFEIFVNFFSVNFFFLLLNSEKVVKPLYYLASRKDCVTG